MFNKNNMNEKDVITTKANEIVHSYGYHVGDVVDYDTVVEIVSDVIKQVYNL